MDTGRPYIVEGEIRSFSKNTSEDELVWHRDYEDRIIEPLHETDWKFQYDNSTPESLKRLFIRKGVYHRLIKGTGDLKLKVIKLWNAIVKYVAVKKDVVAIAVTVNHGKNSFKFLRRFKK